MPADLVLVASTSTTSNPGMHTLVLGLIMLVGTAVGMWLLLKYGGRR